MSGRGRPKATGRLKGMKKKQKKEEPGWMRLHHQHPWRQETQPDKRKNPMKKGVFQEGGERKGSATRENNTRRGGGLSRGAGEK